MNELATSSSRKAILVWSLSLGVLLLLTVISNLVVIQRVRAARERDPRTYLEAADELRKRNDIPAALEQLDEAFRRAPNSPEPYHVSGHLHYQLKQWDQADKAYSRAIELGSEDEGVRLNKLWALIQLQRYEQAAEFGTSSIAQGYSDIAFVRYVGEAYSRAGRQAEAIPFFLEVLKSNPNDLYMMERLRQAYTATGNREQAEAMETRIADVEAAINSLAAGPS